MTLDQFSVNTQHNNVSTLQDISSEECFIPAGYTPVVLVLVKGYIKPLNRQHLREESIACMVKPTGRDISLWIEKAWEQVQHSTITSSALLVFIQFIVISCSSS